MAAPATLEEIVRDALRPHVEELVRRLAPELVAETLNGDPSTLGDSQGDLHTETAANGAGSPPKPTAAIAAAPQSPSTRERRCKLCGVTKPIQQFEPHRHQCKQCRRERERSRRQLSPEPEEPRPAGPTAAELLAGQKATGYVKPRELEEWMTRNELATIEDGRVSLTPYADDLLLALRG